MSRPILKPDRKYEHDDPAAELYGAVTVGELWRFAVLHRPDKLLLRDLGAYRVPEDLNDLLSILFGIVQPAAGAAPAQLKASGSQ